MNNANEKPKPQHLKADGTPYRARGSGSVYLPKHSRFFMVKYYADSRPRHESSHSTDRRVAEKLLARRLQEVAAGEVLTPDVRRVRIDDCVEALLAKHRQDGRKSAEHAANRWKKDLAPHFGGMRAVRLTVDHFARYKTEKLAQGYKPATVNRGLQLVRAALHLAVRHRKLNSMPCPIEMLAEKNVRRGFLSEADHDKLRAACAKHGLWLVGLLETALTYGWRRAEVNNLKCGQIDLFGKGSVRLNPHETKNDAARIVPLADNLRPIISALMVGKKPGDYLFTKENGQRIKNFALRWHAACIEAGLGRFECKKCDSILKGNRCLTCNRRVGRRRRRYVGLLYHDLRRSGARNLLRFGVPEVVAMKITGHKTRSMFDRYCIVAEDDLSKALDKLEQGKRAERELAALEAQRRVPEMLDGQTLVNAKAQKLPS